MQKIVAIFTSSEDGSREDVAIFSSDLILVESDTLKFDEPVFGDREKPNGLGMGEIVDAIKALGYKVIEPEIQYVIASEC